MDRLMRKGIVRGMTLEEINLLIAEGDPLMPAD
jgi:hypothetical protein